jgi:hypothetical protein
MIRFRGHKDMRARLIDEASAFPGKVMKAMTKETEIELKEVNRRTPVEEGDLVESNRIDGPHQERNTIRIFIRSGDEKAFYALYVHEDLEAFHRVGQAKYLESVLFESAPYILGRIAARLGFGR